MVELTEREKIIIQAMTYLLHEVTKPMPFDTKINFLKIALESRNISKSLDELKDIVLAIEREQKGAIQNMMKKLGGING